MDGPKYFNSHKKTDQCTFVRGVYHLLFGHQHVLLAVAIIIKETYKNIRNPNKLVKLYK